MVEKNELFEKDRPPSRHLVAWRQIGCSPLGPHSITDHYKPPTNTTHNSHHHHYYYYYCCCFYYKSIFSSILAGLSLFTFVRSC